MSELTIKELLNIESQLFCPSGMEGTEMGRTMFESNQSMIINSISALKLEEKDKILELGHGNCKHYPEYLSRAKKIKLYGLEISKIMRDEAKKVNFRKKNKADFRVYDGEKIPFKAELFEKVITVNTIYFWKDDVSFLKEIYRVLKPEGIFVLAFAKKEFMKHLPFVMRKFKLYSNNDVVELAQNTGFKILNISDKTEIVKSKTGELVNKEYSIVVLKK